MSKTRTVLSLAKHSFWALMSLGITGFIVAVVIVFWFWVRLPNVETLKNVQLQVPMRIYTSDGKLIGEYGEKRRIPITLNQVPSQLVEALLATEDQRFFEHPGVDFIGLVRAARVLILTGRKTQGASTITMQVARNFFLSRKKTYTRKLNEILLALKLDQDFTKQKILELYFNKIFLGQRAYGVAAAAQVYYGKTLDQLTLPQLAMIAGLPQAPSRDNPISNPVGAKDRRDHVLWRMLKSGYIDQQTYEQAIQTPVTAKYHDLKIAIKAPYIAEMVRDAMVQQYGNAAYTNGYNVYTTINSKLQVAANQALENGLDAYDKRHGYRQPSMNLGLFNEAVLPQWENQLQQMPAVYSMQPAAVVSNADHCCCLLHATSSSGQRC